MSDSDSWRTPQWLFDELNAEFNFVIDLCTSGGLEDNPGNSKVKDMWLGVKDDYLTTNLQSLMKGWENRAAFMNPPYSNPKPFIEKAWEDSKHCKIVCLVKCDPSTKWWSTFYEYDSRRWVDGEFYETDTGAFNRRGEWVKYCGPKLGCDIRFFPKRIQFDPPQQLIDSGEVWKVGSKWVQKCHYCAGFGEMCHISQTTCFDCKGKGYTALSGPTFSSALIIMDREEV